MIKLLFIPTFCPNLNLPLRRHLRECFWKFAYRRLHRFLGILRAHRWDHCQRSFRKQGKNWQSHRGVQLLTAWKRCRTAPSKGKQCRHCLSVGITHLFLQDSTEPHTSCWAQRVAALDLWETERQLNLPIGKIFLMPSIGGQSGTYRLLVGRSTHRRGHDLPTTKHEEPKGFRFRDSLSLNRTSFLTSWISSGVQNPSVHGSILSFNDFLSKNRQSATFKAETRSLLSKIVRQAYLLCSILLRISAVLSFADIL